MHVVIYAVLTLVSFTGFKKQHTYSRFDINSLVFTIVFVSVFHIGMEISQLFTSERSFEWMDILANYTGVGIGLGIFRMAYGKDLFFT